MTVSIITGSEIWNLQQLGDYSKYLVLPIIIVKHTKININLNFLRTRINEKRFLLPHWYYDIRWIKCKKSLTMSCSSIDLESSFINSSSWSMVWSSLSKSCTVYPLSFIINLFLLLFITDSFSSCNHKARLSVIGLSLLNSLYFCLIACAIVKLSPLFTVYRTPLFG